ncbi:hypothetical protein SAMN02745157_2594 [Kaistia soli DSM 19436]|uniref:Uncharacterized protein n=1 Tax=Kaistia soli DSM 19436 TaxID=1122133 RepID=A0A1M5D878_9HYPH|nr:hypothetical protein [Kaistia soli]SHF63218.1 hypothetical protein SAMN02745157_2594 [Kaistia soli DSM 19436]
MQSYRVFMIGGRSASWQDKLKLALLALAGGAVLVAAVILSLGLALVLIPLGFVAYLFRRPLLRALFRQASRSMGTPPPTGAPDGEPRRPAPTGTVTIETDYRVVETREEGRPRT